MGISTGSDPLVKVGDVVEGRYRVIKVLGEGGMGTVFLAEHTLIKRRVAIKVLHSELATDANVVERFMNEARAAGTLGHPNIVESTDMGFTHGHIPYIIFEFLEGALLTDEIYRVGGLPVRRAVWIAQQIASALRAAHNADIVHRDLKSDNIFLTDKDEAMDHVKVLDFGISRFLDHDDDRTQRNMVMGTPEFMAPEQIMSPDSVDRRADIWALGVILYEMLEARRPFPAVSGGDPHDLMHRIVNEEASPLQREGIPFGLCEMILTKLLAKDPADRFQSMADVEASLETFITQDQVRRRRTPVSIPVVNADDIARHSDLIPRPMGARNTPWPNSQSIPTMDPRHSADPTIQPIALTTPPQIKKPWMMYGIAGAGLLVGAVGLMLGMRGGSNNDDQKTAMPAPPPPTAPAPTTATNQPTSNKIAVQFEANHPDARVTFRRRISNAPAGMQITASDIVELVEVSAPGHKTVRYWLTFDRPTTLKATLVKGTGLVEASEEQTLVALGEVAAPTGDERPSQPAVAPVVASNTPKNPTDVTPTPTLAAPQIDRQVATKRKIGKGTDDNAKTVSHDDDNAKVAKFEVTEQPKVTIEAPKPAKPEPKLEPKAAREPKTDDEPKPAVVEPKVDEPKPEPKQEPKPAVVEPVKVEAPKPSIDQATLAAVVGKNRPGVLKCFAEGKKANASLKGTLTVQLAVAPDGSVKRVQVQSTLTGAPMVAACVVKAANGWRFPSRAGGEMATVAYPFVIN